MRPLLLDLFCGAGGAAVGYHNAGFEVVGIDINPMSNYPFRFYQADAMEVLDELLLNECWEAPPSQRTYRRCLDLEDFSAIHASPPCQRYSVAMNAHPGWRSHYPDLVEPTRVRLKETGLPWVIENVVNAPLIDPIMLCGTSFGLRNRGLEIRRHRLFESTIEIPPLECDHRGYAMNVWDGAGCERIRAAFGQTLEDRNGDAVERIWAQTLGVGWMRKQREWRESIPPAFTEYIGAHLINVAAITSALDVPAELAA